jgi:hypothetical protein
MEDFHDLSSLVNIDHFIWALTSVAPSMTPTPPIEFAHIQWNQSPESARRESNIFVQTFCFVRPPN